MRASNEPCPTSCAGESCSGSKVERADCSEGYGTSVRCTCRERSKTLIRDAGVEREIDLGQLRAPFCRTLPRGAGLEADVHTATVDLERRSVGQRGRRAEPPQTRDGQRVRGIDAVHRTGGQLKRDANGRGTRTVYERERVPPELMHSSTRGRQATR